MRSRRVMKLAILAVPAGVLFLGLIGFVVMSLWNGITPALFGWKPIGYWQAAGLLILARLLFGGFRGAGGRGHWRHRMMERCEQMTPEEREKFRQAFNDRWGRVATPDSKPNA
jgi:Ca2+/H+ antiporter, TMEM165/GDT1 family